MRLLLDTHILLWTLGAPERLGNTLSAAIKSPDNDVMFSAVSIWEIAIKSALRRDDFQVAPDEILAAAIESGFTELPVCSAAGAVAELVGNEGGVVSGVFNLESSGVDRHRGG